MKHLLFAFPAILVALLSVTVLGASPAFSAPPECEKLSLRACVMTKGCFLECGTKDRSKCEPYRCRTAVGKCETTYRQWGLQKHHCTSIGGCEYEEPVCFCPGPESCFCGGGAPPTCRAKE